MQRNIPADFKLRAGVQVMSSDDTRLKDLHAQVPSRLAPK